MQPDRLEELEPLVPMVLLARLELPDLAETPELLVSWVQSAPLEAPVTPVHEVAPEHLV